MNKVFVLSKGRVIDCFVILWAVSVALATLSQGAVDMNYSGLTYPVVFLPALIFFVSKVSLVNTLRKQVSLGFLFVLLVAGLISSAYHSDLAMVFSLFTFALLIVLGLYVYPSLISRRRQLIFFKSVFYFSLAYFFGYVSQYGLMLRTSLHYGNTNTLGVAAATVAILGLGLFFYSVEQKVALRARFFYGVGVLFMAYLAVLSVSRAALLSIFLVLFLLAFSYFFRVSGMRKIRFAMIFLLVGGVFLFVFGDVFFEALVDKFERKEGDVLDGRGKLWQFIITNTGLLGLGMDFFRYDAFIAAHSTYFSFLGRYGWLLFIPFVFFLIYLAWGIFRTLVFKGGDSIGFVYLAVFVGFLLTSISEIMIFKSIMVYAFLFLGGFARFGDSAGASVTASGRCC